MPYLGKSPHQGNYSKLDDFSGNMTAKLKVVKEDNPKE
tara:strand:- start:433 stop:546 length:114 start_codon:yes stop_codon:yes gene_type:complete